MTSAADYVIILSRLQFAITTLFHILWPVLTIGLSLFLVVTESLWPRTGDVAWYHHTRFWGRLFLLNFAVGVVTGLPLEFEFGTNWAAFSKVAGGFFGNMLGFEGGMAFMLEAGFLGIMVFGWQRVPRAMHLTATAMVAFGASLSAFWILVANSWMQTPAAAIWRTASSCSTATCRLSSIPICRGAFRICGSPVWKPACS
jgi:cytochrome d ubiquinol oxidase subunit I